MFAEALTSWSVDTALSDDVGVEADRLESETLPRSAGAFVDGSCSVMASIRLETFTALLFRCVLLVSW